MLAHLLKYDSSQGRYAGHTVTVGEDNASIVVDGKQITIYKEADASNLPWGDLDVDVVLECTGFYTSKAKAEAHIKAGAKKVVISAPAGNDLPTIVYSVNEKTLTADDKIISAASCTTNCLAPMVSHMVLYLILHRQWFLQLAMIYIRCRLFHGMIMKTPTQARWLEQSNILLNWLNFEIRINK